MVMKKIPFHLQLIRGAIGKRFVIKHYGKKIVMTAFPDMTQIKPSIKQQECRQQFAAAVAYAQGVINNAEQKELWQKKIKKGKSVYRAAIQEYLLMLKAKRANCRGTGAERILRLNVPKQISGNLLIRLMGQRQPGLYMAAGKYLPYLETG
jgi:hypothetical protein